MQQLKKTISGIINSIRVVEGNTVYLIGKTAGLVSKDNSKNKSFVNSLAEIIYSDFYITGGTKKKSNLDSRPAKNNLLRRLNFIEKLKQAYVFEQAFDNGWTVEERDNNGTIYARKYDRIVQLKPGQFIKKDNNANNNISVYVPEFKNQEKNYFYFIKGITPINSVISQRVRFYFNLDAGGAPLAITLISKRFNDFGIPFLFKCCSNPSDYIRTDSAVLYVENYYFNISLQLLSEIISYLKPFLKTSVPLFTLKLSNGFSFAEDLPDGNSFGMNRSLLVASAVCEAVKRKLKRNSWLMFILKEIKKDGFNEKKMYLNAGSVYPYDFSIFTDGKK